VSKKVYLQRTQIT